MDESQKSMNLKPEIAQAELPKSTIEVTSIKTQEIKTVVEDENSRKGLGEEIAAFNSENKNTSNVDENGYIKVEKQAGVLSNPMQSFGDEILKKISK